MDAKSQEAFYRLTVLNPEEDIIKNLKSERIDWEGVIDIAYRLSSPFILYKNIKRYNLGDRFKPDTLSRLKTSYLDTVVKNMLFVNDFFKLAGLFNKEDIRLTPLKGISMLIDTYFDDGLRPIVDLDVFIDMNDFAKALDLLNKSGYKINVRPETRGLIDTNHGQDHLVLSPGKCSIELHYRLFAWYEEKYVYKIDCPRFLNDSFFKTVNGFKLNFLRKEDEFYYLLMNVFNNSCRIFRYYLDCDSIVRVYGSSFDWDRVARHIRSSGIKVPIVKILNFIIERLKTPVPSRLVKEASIKSTVLAVEKNLYGSRINRYGQQLNNLFGTQDILDKMNLVMIYIKWLCFKGLGLFRKFFMIHNNPRPAKIID